MTWQQDAACVGADPARFEPIDRWEPNLELELQETARTFCRGCPVLKDCAAYADRNRHGGIWGGSYRPGATNKYTARALIAEAPELVLTDRRSGVRTGWAA